MASVTFNLLTARKYIEQYDGCLVTGYFSPVHVQMMPIWYVPCDLSATIHKPLYL